jgi:hypothetical protein
LARIAASDHVRQLAVEEFHCDVFIVVAIARLNLPEPSRVAGGGGKPRLNAWHPDANILNQPIRRRGCKRSAHFLGKPFE